MRLVSTESWASGPARNPDSPIASLYAAYTRPCSGERRRLSLPLADAGKLGNEPIRRRLTSGREAAIPITIAARSDAGFPV